MRGKLGVVALLLVSTMFAVLLAEGILRAFPGLMSEGAAARVNWATIGRNDPVTPHPYIGIVPQPEGFKPGDDITDAPAEQIWGQRNLAPWPDNPDVLVVGDSFSYSQTVAVDDAWTINVDRAMTGSRLVTLGTVSTGPQQYLRVFETYGAAMAPKVLITGMFLGNDLHDAVRFERWLTESPDIDYRRYILVGDRNDFFFWLKRLANKSYLAAVIRDYMLLSSRDRLFQGETLDLPSGEQVQLIPRFHLRTAATAEPGHQGFDLTIQNTVSLHEKAKAGGSNAVVLIFPSKEEVYGQFLEDDLPDLSARVREELAARDIEYLDLGPAFRDRARDGYALFHVVDGHPNERGYALIAETVFAYLKDNADRLGIEIEAPRESHAGAEE